MEDRRVESGDVVKLKSGGPKMTAYWENDGWIDCGWFDSDDVYRKEGFPVEALIVVKVEESN